MSLEATIAENTAAIRELIAAISKGIPTTAAQVAAVVDEAPAAEKKTSTKKSTKPSMFDEQTEAPKSEQAAATPEPKADAAPAAAEAKAVTYADAAAAITKLSREKSRDAALAVLGKFGAAKLPEVKPEDFAAVIDAANEALGV
jgi:FtsZ-interacting cell division protein ZipA